MLSQLFYYSLESFLLIALDTGLPYLVGSFPKFFIFILSIEYQSIGKVDILKLLKKIKNYFIFKYINFNYGASNKIIRHWVPELKYTLFNYRFLSNNYELNQHLDCSVISYVMCKMYPKPVAVVKMKHLRVRVNPEPPVLLTH